MTSRLSSMGRGDLGLPTRRKTVVGDFSSNTGKSRIPGPSTSSSSLGVRQSLIGKGSRVSSAGLPSSRRRLAVFRKVNLGNGVFACLFVKCANVSCV